MPKTAIFVRLWRLENYQEFLDYRRKAIVYAINDFIADLE